ncbi:MAG TPA: tetratricopeptide repeat protein [Spongiibacteraceae bacterium]|jgi:Tfp pilus assembly protein PilF
MKYVKRAALGGFLPSRILVIAVLLLLSACQMAPAKPAQKNAAQEIPAAAQTLFDSAIVAQREQQWPQAEQQLKQLTEKYPQLSGPHLNLALVYAQTQRGELAEAEFKQALQVNPNNLAAYDQYGIWLRGQTRMQEAETIYLQALARNPEHADTHLDLGILYDLYMGKLPQALEQYQRYLELTNDEKSPVRGWVADLQRRIKAAN